MPVTVRILIVVPALVLQFGCAGSPPPVPTPLLASDSIPEWQIREEMRSLGGGTNYALLFGVLGVPVGFALGARIGYAIGAGGEDSEVDGAMLGGFAGAVTVPIIGAVVGSSIDRKHKRAEAIRNIRARRAQQTR